MFTTLFLCHIMKFMKTLDQKEWIAIIIAIFVVGFFFVFGPGLLSLFNSNQTDTVTTQSPQITSVDTVVGTGDEALVGDRVTVHYTGKFIDGRVFDSSLTRGEPFQFVLGA